MLPAMTQRRTGTRATERWVNIELFYALAIHRRLTLAKACRVIGVSMMRWSSWRRVRAVPMWAARLLAYELGIKPPKMIVPATGKGPRIPRKVALPDKLFEPKAWGHNSHCPTEGSWEDEVLDLFSGLLDGQEPISGLDRPLLPSRQKPSAPTEPPAPCEEVDEAVAEWLRS